MFPSEATSLFRLKILNELRLLKLDQTGKESTWQILPASLRAAVLTHMACVAGGM